MNKLDFNLENCYGIKKLKHSFDFESSKAHLVYAPNGVMKSSLAQTLEDISINANTKDRIFPDRVNHREIKIDDVDISHDEIFVIQRMRTSDFKEASTILANEVLKKEYDEINQKINETKNEFLGLVQPNFGLKTKQIEGEITGIYNLTFFAFLEKYEAQILENESPVYSNIIYNEVFNEKVLKFLNDKDFKLKIKEYITTFDKLVNENDTLFMKGTFNHYHADTVSKSLKDNNFFSANHKVKIKNHEIGSIAELEGLIKAEKDKVLNDPELSKRFQEIDKQLSGNVELRKFRSYVEDNQEIIKEFVDLKNFRLKLILNFIALVKSEFIALLKEYRDTNTRRNEIIAKAKVEQSDWKKVLEIFNRRFTVPFKVKIKNQEGVILNNEPASLIFEYSDGAGSENIRELGGPELQTSLSTGEQRVFYLLNVIFQIETKRKLPKNQLVIVDDIADSFDYKNKYAIIEYLKDILSEEKFFMIILTHNFDFYKTIKSRLGGAINYQGNWIAVKKLNEIIFVPGERKDVFPTLREKFDQCDFTFIACIPFVRNLVEFSIGEDNKNFRLLTSLLHLKPEIPEASISKTKEIRRSDVFQIFNETFGTSKTTASPDDKVYDLVLTKAREIINSPDDFSADIKTKICLSLAIRLKAEEFMLSKIVDSDFHLNILKKQTGKIFEKYKKEHPSHIREIGILDRVNLMTAENIHVNSFMYEPLLDLSDDHLRKLYGDVFSLV